MEVISSVLVQSCTSVPPSALSCYVHEYLPFKMGLLLFTRRVSSLKTFEHIGAYWAIKALRFCTVSDKGVCDTDRNM